MTEFMYENGERIRRLCTNYFKKDKAYIINTPEELRVYKYMLSYLSVIGANISNKNLDSFRKEAMRVDSSTRNLVFFEKLERYTIDVIYFQQYMNECERDPQFRSTWYTDFSKTA